MTPFRLLILALLVFACWRLARRRFSAKRPQAKADNVAEPQDVLVEDPACHLLIPKHQALRLRKDGVTYFFCSEQCCDLFIEKLNKGEL